MNQDQRKYLTEVVQRTYKRQYEKLQGDQPIAPSLNNYLVAACLDGSLKLQDVEGLRDKIRQRVLKFGKDDKLVRERDEYSFRNRNNKDKGDVTLAAEDIFIFPEAYIKAMEEYNNKKKQYEDQLELLESQKDTIILKIQVGSPASLAKLVSEVDNIADLSIVNSTLTLAGAANQIEEKTSGSKSKK